MDERAKTRVGIATIKDNKFHLKYNFYSKERCNCHPETCCCSGYDLVKRNNEILVINNEGLIEGNSYEFELRKVELKYYGNNAVAEMVYILNGNINNIKTD